MGLTKLQQLALTWFFALGLSALMVAVGRRWPQPPPIQPAWVWVALLLLPLLTLVGLVARWPVPEEGESSDAMQKR